MSEPSPRPHPRATLTSEYQRDWPAYFDAVKSQPPRATCLMALDAFEREGPAPSRVAIDIACGEGRDTRAMLARGFSVVAVDSSAEGLSRLASGLDPAHRTRVTLVHASMEEIPARFSEPFRQRPDLINASFALPFCDPAAFPRLWEWIVRVLPPGGRFAGQLFGDRDEWKPVRPASHHTREQALHLLRHFRLEHFEEVEKDGSDAMGGEKHHHLFHIVGQRTGD